MTQVELDGSRTGVSEHAGTDSSLDNGEANPRDRSAELHALHEISLQLNAQSDLSQLLQQIVEHAARLLEAELGSLCLYDTESEHLIIRVTTPSLGHLVGICIRPGDGAAGRAFSERRTIARQDYASWPGRLRHVRESERLNSMLAVPLIGQESVLGVLAIGDERRGFDAHDIWLVEMFAAQAAVALDSARLRNELERRAAENLRLLQSEREQTRLLRDAEARMARVDKIAALGSLTAALAHEINNPLQAIQSHLELVMDFPLSPDQQTEFLGVIRQEIGRLNEIVQRVLSYARPTETPYLPIALHDLIAQTLALLRKQILRQRIHVEVDVSEDLVLNVGRDQMVQVFVNLLLNAVEAIGSGGHICISARVDGPEVAVRFTNDGPHIPEEHLPHVFEPFYTTKPTGTGLGLAVSRTLVDQCGGTLTAANCPGDNGVVFTARLPLAHDPVAANRAPDPIAHRQDLATSLAECLERWERDVTA